MELGPEQRMNHQQQKESHRWRESGQFYQREPVGEDPALQHRPSAELLKRLQQPEVNERVLFGDRLQEIQTEIQRLRRIIPCSPNHPLSCRATLGLKTTRGV